MFIRLLFSITFKEEILAEFPKLLAEDERDLLKVTYDLIRRIKNASGEANPLLPLLKELIWQAGSCELRDNAEVIFQVNDNLGEIQHIFSRIVIGSNQGNNC